MATPRMTTADIVRQLVWVVRQPVGTDDSFVDLGAVQCEFFFIPAKTKDLPFGVGPDFQLPTETNSTIGPGRWGLGPYSQWTIPPSGVAKIFLIGKQAIKTHVVVYANVLHPSGTADTVLQKQRQFLRPKKMTPREWSQSSRRKDTSSHVSQCFIPLGSPSSRNI